MELILQKFKLFVIGFFSSIALISLTFLVGFSANADEYPNKPIDIVIHAKYGGGTDTTARMASIRSRRILKTDIRIVSKRGGAGAKAQNYVLSKPADGYTVMALTQTHLYTMARGKSNMKIDDIVGVARAMDDPTFITVSGKSKYKSLDDVISASKKAPLNWGVATVSYTHLTLPTICSV